MSKQEAILKTTGLLVFVGLELLSPRGAFAQPSIVDALRPYKSELLIVRTSADRDLLVRLVDVSPDQISVTVAGMPRDIAVNRVIEVARTRRDTVKGAKIGAAIGLGLGVLATQGLDCSDCLAKGTALVGLSTAAYAGIGAWVGSRHHSRFVVYRALRPHSKKSSSSRAP